MHVLWFLCFTYAPAGWKLDGKGLRTLELEGLDVGELSICQFFNKTKPFHLSFCPLKQLDFYGSSSVFPEFYYLSQ